MIARYFAPRYDGRSVRYARCLPSLRGGGPRQDGARSAGVKVLCEVRSTVVLSDTALAPAPCRDGVLGTVPVSRGAIASLNTS